MSVAGRARGVASPPTRRETAVPSFAANGGKSRRGRHFRRPRKRSGNRGHDATRPRRTSDMSAFLITALRSDIVTDLLGRRWGGSRALCANV